MRRPRRSFSFLAALIWLMLPVVPASAEWFADLYAGPVFSQTRNVEVDSGDIGRTAKQKDVKIDTAVSFGGRAGYWFEFEPVLGLGLDVSHFASNTSKQTVTRVVCISGGCTAGQVEDKGGDGGVTVIGLDVLLRYPLLTSPQFPKGRLQPYFTGGPALFIADVENNGFVPAGQTDTNTTLGLKVGAGLAWQVHRHLAVFGEYRFTHFKPQFHFTDAVIGSTTVSSTSNRNQVLFGVSLRY